MFGPGASAAGASASGVGVWLLGGGGGPEGVFRPLWLLFGGCGAW
jgi:hypothetical protein